MLHRPFEAAAASAGAGATCQFLKQRVLTLEADTQNVPKYPRLGLPVVSLSSSERPAAVT